MRIIRSRFHGALPLLLALLTPAGGAHALDLMATAGSPGAGLTVQVPLTEVFRARAGFNAWTFDHDFDDGDLRYQTEVRLRSFHLLADWYPTGEGFRLTTGAVLNQNRLEGEATVTSGGVVIGGGVYGPGQVESLRSEVRFRTLAPYLGVGFDRHFGAEKHWGVGFDFGVMFQGKPRVDLEASGSATGSGTFQRDLQQEERDLADDVSSFRYFPVISAQLRYAF